MTLILPTFTCFDDAVEIIGQILTAHPDARDTDEFLIVHAICWRPSLGNFAHAWIENDHGKGVAFFFGIIDGKREMLCERLDTHYRRLRVKEAKKYTVREAVAMELKTLSYGPWEKRFIKLCSENHQMEKIGGQYARGRKERPGEVDMAKSGSFEADLSQGTTIQKKSSFDIEPGDPLRRERRNNVGRDQR